LIAILLTALLLAEAPTTPPTAAPAGEIAKDDATPTLSLALKASVPSADGRPLEVKLSEPLVLELVASAGRDTELFVPMLPALGTFEIVKPEPGTEKVEGMQKTLTWRWTILPVRLGMEKIPAIEVPYRTATGREGSVSTEVLRVSVRGFLENENAPQLGKAPEPVDVITTNWLLVWGLTVGGAIVFAALGTWLVLLGLRQRFEAMKPPPPPRPANERALERLAEIDLRSAGELPGDQRLAATIDTLREYISGRYGIDALEMTTRELETALPSLDLKGVAPIEIEALLKEADLVKFARLVPSESEARRPLEVVRKIVLDTWEPPKVVEVFERAEPAKPRQRFWAGVIDLVLFGGLSLMLFGGLWVSGALEWGWTALVLLGLLLVGRDLFGRSAGKRLLQITIVRRDARQTHTTARMRLTRNILLLLWPVALPLEWLILRQHPLGLRLGDLIAETEVVRARAISTPSRSGEAPR
jgi:uncharacterized RDD family membrane protein YckC